MRVLLDTDVIIDVAIDRQPFSVASGEILSMVENGFIEAYLAWHSIANFYYLVSSGKNESKARKFIKEILEFVDIAKTGKREAMFALQLQMKDFEDALQVSAANACLAEWIISRNLKHYRNSPVPAISPTEFIKKSR